MTGRAGIARGLFAVAALCLVGSGCSGGGSAASAPTAGTQQATLEASAPPTEATGAERPLPQTDQPAVQVVGLPIGGGFDKTSAPPGCVDVNLHGDQPANGIAVAVDEVAVTSPFSVLAGAGPCDSPPCAGHFFASDSASCSVLIDWPTAPPESKFHGWLTLTGHCVASSGGDCTQWKSSPGERIEVTATLPAGSSS